MTQADLECVVGLDACEHHSPLMRSQKTREKQLYQPYGKLTQAEQDKDGVWVDKTSVIYLECFVIVRFRSHRRLLLPNQLPRFPRHLRILGPPPNQEPKAGGHRGRGNGGLRRRQKGALQGVGVVCRGTGIAA